MNDYVHVQVNATKRQKHLHLGPSAAQAVAIHHVPS